MYSRISVAVLFFISSALADGIIPPRPRCPPNEIYTTCGGCEPGCSISNGACAAVCRVGCTCRDGYVRDNGKCIPREQCPCKPSEVYLKCGRCDGTCNNTQPICTADCKPAGCYCIEGYVRDKARECIPVDKCPTRCKSGEVWKDCGCEGTCKNPRLICPLKCMPKCYCNDDLVRDDLNRCISYKQCQIYG